MDHKENLDIIKGPIYASYYDKLKDEATAEISSATKKLKHSDMLLRLTRIEKNLQKINFHFGL